MWTLISVSFALLINFCSPNVSKKNSKNTAPTDKIITGFPYQYFEKEVLTEDIVDVRIRLIYIYFMIYVTVIFSVGPLVGPIVGQNTLVSTPKSVERLVPNQLDSQTKNEELFLDLRGGGGDFAESIIKILLIWTMAKNAIPTDGFQPKPINPQNFGRQGHTQRNPRIAPKLQENPANQNNQKHNHSSPSMDELAHSLSPEWSEFQSKYHSESLSDRFDTKNYSVEEFKELAKDPRANSVKYDRVSVDEARAVIQAESENHVIHPTRPDKETAKVVDLDYKVEGPGLFTHCDVKTPVGSQIMKKQGQTKITLEKASYRLGQKIVAQKHKFVGLDNGPSSAENVSHIVDLSYVPCSEKEIVKQNILQGASDTGSDSGIIFLNDKR